MVAPGSEVSTERPADSKLFTALLIGFAGQVAGRLVDLRWHLTHDELEGGVEQLQAHWLIWLATAFVLGVSTMAVRRVQEPAQRWGYIIVLAANAGYGAIAVIHFFQHLNRSEVDWAHALLVVTSVAAVIGVLWVIAARLVRKWTREPA
jgi:drug/metabolite transporter (DMT)-like permease